MMNNSESGEETWHLGWDRCYLPRLPAQRWFWWSSSLGTVYGHFLESSSLYLLLKSISTRLREITLPIYNNTSDSCDGIMSSRGWNNVIESLVIQEMALFPNIFHALGEKRLLVLTSVSHSCSFVIWKPLFPSCCSAAPCWTSISLSSSTIVFKGLFS